MIFQKLSIFRLNSWWNYILPPVLSAVYFVVYITGIEFSESIPLILLWFISIVGTAIFGFAVNDIFDADIDKKAGKTNHLALLPKWKQWMIVLFSFFLASTPWFFLNLNSSALILLIFQLVLLVFYSTPPIRLKNNPYLSIISDSLYSGMIFIIAIIVAGNIEFESFKFPYIFFAITVNILFLRGLRNILIHQIIDAENDIKSNTQTLVISYGEQTIYKILSFILLPIEIIMIVLFCLFLVLKIDFAWIIIPMLIIFYAVKLFDAKAEKNKILKIQIINDFYEDIFPVFILILLSFIDYYYLILLFVHVIVFKNKVVWLLLPWLYYKTFFNKHIQKIYKIFGLNVNA